MLSVITSPIEIPVFAIDSSPSSAGSANTIEDDSFVLAFETIQKRMEVLSNDSNLHKGLMIIKCQNYLMKNNEYKKLPIWVQKQLRCKEFLLYFDE